MKLLRCLLCRGEVDVVGHDRSINRKTKCRKCGHGSAGTENKPAPEVIVMRRRPLAVN